MNYLHKLNCLTLSIILSLQTLILSAKQVQLLASNLELSNRIIKNLKVNPTSWDYKKAPYIHFTVGTEGKVRNIQAVKYANNRNSNECIAAIFKSEPFDSKFYGQSYGFECKPTIGYSKKQIKEAKKYTSDYMTTLQKKIKNNWHPSKNGKSYDSLASFLIDKNGNVQNLKLKKVSGSDEADQIAIRAIELSSPFDRPDLNKMLSTDSNGIEIEFSFDYNLVQNSSPQSSTALGLGLGAIGAAALFSNPRPYRYGYYNRPYYYRRR